MGKRPMWISIYFIWIEKSVLDGKVQHPNWHSSIYELRNQKKSEGRQIKNKMPWIGNQFVFIHVTNFPKNPFCLSYYTCCANNSIYIYVIAIFNLPLYASITILFHYTWYIRSWTNYKNLTVRGSLPFGKTKMSKINLCYAKQTH